MILVSSRGLVALVFPKISQFLVIFSLNLGLFGLCVIAQ